MAEESKEMDNSNNGAAAPAPAAAAAAMDDEGASAEPAQADKLYKICSIDRHFITICQYLIGRINSNRDINIPNTHMFVISGKSKMRGKDKHRLEKAFVALYPPRPTDTVVDREYINKLLTDYDGEKDGRQLEIILETNCPKPDVLFHNDRKAANIFPLDASAQAQATLSNGDKRGRYLSNAIDSFTEMLQGVWGLGELHLSLSIQQKLNEIRRPLLKQWIVLSYMYYMFGCYQDIDTAIQYSNYVSRSGRSGGAEDKDDYQLYNDVMQSVIPADPDHQHDTTGFANNGINLERIGVVTSNVYNVCQTATNSIISFDDVSHVQLTRDESKNRENLSNINLIKDNFTSVMIEPDANGDYVGGVCATFTDDDKIKLMSAYGSMLKLLKLYGKRSSRINNKDVLSYSLMDKRDFKQVIRNINSFLKGKVKVSITGEGLVIDIGTSVATLTTDDIDQPIYESRSSLLSSSSSSSTDPSKLKSLTDLRKFLIQTCEIDEKYFENNKFETDIYGFTQKANIFDGKFVKDPSGAVQTTAPAGGAASGSGGGAASGSGGGAASGSGGNRKQYNRRKITLFKKHR